MFQKSIVPPLRLTFLMWLAFAIQTSTEIDLGFLGIFPRQTNGLIGILTAPLIHGDLNHIISNTFPFLFLGSTLFFFYNRIAIWVFSGCYIITGTLVWFFGRSFFHIGASGVVYGLAFFLIFLGFFRKDLKSLAIAIFVVALYGGMIYGVMPSDPNISWESHAFGAATGVSLSFVFRLPSSKD